MPKKEIITIKNNNIDEIEKLRNKSIALQNSEVLGDILDTLNKLTDLMRDIHLNTIKMNQQFTKMEETKKDNWFY